MPYGLKSYANGIESVSSVNPLNITYCVSLNQEGVHYTPLPSGTPPGSTALAVHLMGEIPISYNLGGSSNKSIALRNVRIEGDRIRWECIYVDSGEWGNRKILLCFRR